jgi:hypothetical protein
VFSDGIDRPVRVERDLILQKELLNEMTQRLAAEEASVKVTRLETALAFSSSQLAFTTRAISELQEQILKLQEALKGQEETQQACGPRCGISLHGPVTVT